MKTVHHVNEPKADSTVVVNEAALRSSTTLMWLVPWLGVGGTAWSGG